MGALLDMIDGKKSYLVSFGIFIVGGLQALGYEIPQWVFTMLAGASGYAARSALAKIERK